MNSLTELNGYASALSFDFTDNRNANVTFDRSTGTAQSAIIDEGFALTTPIGIEITDIINSDASAPTYTINVSAVAGTNVTWATLPTGVTASTPSTGVYRLSGIKTKAQWDAVKVATVTPPSSYNGIFAITTTIAYYSQADGNQTKSWTTTVTVNDVVFLTSPLEFTYPASATTTITNTTQIVNVDATYPGATWTVVGTPSSISSVDTFTTTGTGGSFSVNASTKVITISGTRAQVNARLAGLQIDSNATSVDFSITYALTNNQNSTTDSAIQIMKSQGLVYLGAVTTSTIYFTEDAASQTITGVPLVTDSAYDGSGQYTFTVTPSTTSAISTMTTTGTEGSQSFNNSTKVLTVLGTRSQINTRMLSLSIKTAVDWGTDFTLSYSVSTPRTDTATKLQILACGSNDTEVTNMNVTRSYTANRENSIFSTSIPSITDFDTAEGNQYTISFSSSLGLFGFATETPVTTLTFTGTKAQASAKFSAVRFWPTADVSSNGTFTYIQQKNSVEQVNQNVSLTGTAGTYTATRSIAITSSQNWVPNVEDALYGKIASLTLVGGGGGGGGGFAGSGFSYGGGGGGGGGVRYSATPISLTINTSYPLVVGAGGLAGTSGNSPTNGGTGGTTSAFSLSIGGGAGGSLGAGAGGSSGAGIGSAYLDDNGLGGANPSFTGTNRGGGGGGGHYSINGSILQNGSASSGGRGQYGFDEPGGANAFYGAGGGGGGPTGGSAGNVNTAGSGANSTRSALAANLSYGGGGGGGGYGAFSAGAGTNGVIIFRLVAK